MHIAYIDSAYQFHILFQVQNHVHRINCPHKQESRAAIKPCNVYGTFSIWSLKFTFHFQFYILSDINGNRKAWLRVVSYFKLVTDAWGVIIMYYGSWWVKCLNTCTKMYKSSLFILLGCCVITVNDLQSCSTNIWIWTLIYHWRLQPYFFLTYLYLKQGSRYRSVSWLISFAKVYSSCKECEARITKWRKFLPKMGLQVMVNLILGSFAT